MRIPKSFNQSWLAILCIIASTAASTQPLQAQSSKPNVVLIVVDDLNDYVGFLGGHPQTETPFMDELARRSTVFENAYCASPVCAPSRTTLMTGKDPSYTDVYSNSGKYVARRTFRDIFTPADNNETIYTLPEVLKDSGGYYTANFHKIYHGWSDEGYDNDFDDIGAPCAKTKSWSQFMDYGLTEDQFPIDDDSSYGTFFHGMNGMPMGPLKPEQEDSMNDTRMITRAINFFQQYATNPADFCDQPFFAAIGIFRPHLPYLAPERFYSEYYERDYTQFPYAVPYNEPSHIWPPNGVVHAAAPEFKGQDYDYLSDFAKHLSLGTAKTNEQFKTFAAEYEPLPQFAPGLDSAQRREMLEESQRALALLNYLASIRYADHQVGRLTGAIHAIPQLANNTIIVLVSDNGYSFREHQHYHKFSLWETDVRIPMMIFDPRNPVENRVSKRTVGLIDLFPTILELTQTPAPTFSDGSRYEDGISLAPLLDDPEAQMNRPALSTTRAPTLSGDDGTCNSQFSIRSEAWHYIRYQTNGGGAVCIADSSEFIEELYHIGRNREIDAEEWENLAGDSTYDLLIDYLTQWIPSGPLFGQSTGTLSIDGITCADTLRLTANYMGTEPISQYWIVNDSIITDSVLNLQISAPTVVQLVGEASDYFLLDFQTVYPAAVDASFTVSTNENVAEINVSQTMKSFWDYGDGMTYTGRAMGHTYTRAGTFLITRKAEIGGCSTYDSAYVTIADSSLENICVPPQSASVINLSSGKARVQWTGVYGATAYEVSFRPKYLSNFNNWTSFTTTDTVVVLAKLVPDREYAFRIRTLGDSCLSDWSAMQNFVTGKCDPPSIAAIDSLTGTSVFFNWTPGMFGNIINQQMGYMPVTGPPPVIQSFPLTTGNGFFGGLTPGATYWLRGRSVCQQYDGTNRFSLLSYPIQFTTPSARAAAEKVPQLGIYDLLGRKLVDASEMGDWPQGTPPAAMLPSWLPAGTYFVNGEMVVK